MTPNKRPIYEFKKESLIEVRQQLGISQGRMAELLGKPANTLSRWETGSTVPDAESLALIYSLARENGVEPPSFFGIVDNTDPIKLGSPDFEQDPIEAIKLVSALKGYLKTQIEDIGTVTDPVMKVTITNTAPDNPEIPKIVFTGVGLSIATMSKNSPDLAHRLRPRITKIPKEQIKQTNLDEAPWNNDTKRKDLLKISYYRLDRKEFPEFTSAEREQGEMLFPGDLLIYEIDVSREQLPFLSLRTEGNVSRRYLYRCEEIFEMPEELTKPLAIAALKEFNNNDVHKPLTSVLKSIPELNDDTRLSDIHEFNRILTESIQDTESLQTNINTVFRQHNQNWLKSHIRAAYMYLDIVKKELVGLKAAIESNDPNNIVIAVSSIKSLKAIATKLNHETEELLSKFHISDNEVDYHYRDMK